MNNPCKTLPARAINKTRRRINFVSETVTRIRVVRANKNTSKCLTKTRSHLPYVGHGHDFRLDQMIAHHAESKRKDPSANVRETGP